MSNEVLPSHLYGLQIFSFVLFFPMIEICYLAASIVSVNRQDCSLVGIGPANCVIVFPHNNFGRPVVF